MNIQQPFESSRAHYIGRHGESKGNTGTLGQGRGEDEPGKPNGLTDEGKLQMRTTYYALGAAGVKIRHISSTRLKRAEESKEVYLEIASLPKPEDRGVVQGLVEVSQKGWEGKFDRNRIKTLRKDAISRQADLLTRFGLNEELLGLIPWITPFGQGETPLGAGLDGIKAIENHKVKSGELIISHAMLNRYMDAVGTSTTSADRRDLERLSTNTTALGSIALIEALKDQGLPDFVTADDPRNRQANGGVTEYQTHPSTGLWIPGRRIQPTPSPHTNGKLFTIDRRSPEGIWTRAA